MRYSSWKAEGTKILFLLVDEQKNVTKSSSFRKFLHLKGREEKHLHVYVMLFSIAGVHACRQTYMYAHGP